MYWFAADLFADFLAFKNIRSLLFTSIYHCRRKAVYVKSQYFGINASPI
jgi:hypothetical protein